MNLSVAPQVDWRENSGMVDAVESDDDAPLVDLLAKAAEPGAEVDLVPQAQAPWCLHACLGFHTRVGP